VAGAAGKVVVGFEGGKPSSVNGKALGPVELLEKLNQIAGRHGVGRADVVESRLVGMKSRGVYETPGGTVLHEALDDLCRLVLPHDLLRPRAELAVRYADLVYNGLWFSPLRRALQSFADTALEVATGEVTVELYKGRAVAVGRTSPRTLYIPQLASFDMAGYRPRTPRASSGSSALPLATAARAHDEGESGTAQKKAEHVGGATR
jgi:argininosuccinate synthase